VSRRDATRGEACACYWVDQFARILLSTPAQRVWTTLMASANTMVGSNPTEHQTRSERQPCLQLLLVRRQGRLSCSRSHSINSRAVGPRIVVTQRPVGGHKVAVHAAIPGCASLCLHDSIPVDVMARHWEASKASKACQHFN
jgi:hypothetical protein